MSSRVGGYNTVRDVSSISVVGRRAYVADGAAGLQIIDVSNLAELRYVGGCDTNPVRNIVVESNFAYGVGSKELRVFNVAVPTDRPSECAG